MRSAQSRLGVVTALGSARRGTLRCVESLPVPTSALKVGGAAFAGLAGAVLLRGLFSSRRKKKATAVVAAPSAASSRGGMGVLLSETLLTLLLPLCRRYFLGENLPGGVASAKIADRILKGGQ